MSRTNNNSISIMNLVSSLQKDYQQLWKHIIRPARTPYPESKLGPALFQFQGTTVQRKDFTLTNSRGSEFTCSLWIPTHALRSHCVIYLHGNSSNRIEGMEYLLKLVPEGIALCTFDFSGCGNAEGEYISLGFYEQQDLQLVIDYLAIYPRIGRIALWGRSMGAVTAMLYLGERQTVAAAVFDSPFKSFKGLIEDMSNKTTKIPGILISAALRIVDRTVQQKGKFSLYSLDPLKSSAPRIQVPAFFIVGIEDEVIPIEHTSQLFQAYAADDKIIKMVNGGHNDARPDIIVDLIIEFLKSRLQDPPKTEQHHSTHIVTKQKQQETQQKQDEVVEDLPIKEVEVQKLHEAVSNGQFSWSNLFSGFTNKSRKQEKEDREPKKEENASKKDKQVNKEIKESKEAGEKIQQQAQKLERGKVQAEEKEKKKLKKKKEKEQMLKSKFEATLEEKVREYSFCYL